MYIGDKKIEKIDWNTVYFANGKVKEYTPKQLWYLVTKKSKDLTEVRHLVLDNVLKDLRNVMWWDPVEVAKAMFEVLELHDVTNIELQVILQRMLTDRVAEYNELVMSKLWEETTAFRKDRETIEEVQKLVTDSFQKSFWIASWAVFWTYEAWKPAESCLEDIRMSDISRIMKQL